MIFPLPVSLLKLGYDWLSAVRKVFFVLVFLVFGFFGFFFFWLLAWYSRIYKDVYQNVERDEWKKTGRCKEAALRKLQGNYIGLPYRRIKRLNKEEKIYIFTLSFKGIWTDSYPKSLVREYLGTNIQIKSSSTFNHNWKWTISFGEKKIKDSSKEMQLCEWIRVVHWST